MTLDLIADLHAGVLDETDAAVVRRRVADDPDAQRAFAALDRVQATLADFGEHPPDDSHIVTGWGSGGVHAARPRRSWSRLRLFGVVAGLGAIVVAAAVGTLALVRLPPSAPLDTGPSARHITVAAPDPTMPLSDDEIVALLGNTPDFGPLADQQRRVSCLAGLGYPADTDVLGATALDVRGNPAVLLVVAGESPDEVVALLVPASCSAINTGLIADTEVTVP